MEGGGGAKRMLAFVPGVSWGLGLFSNFRTVVRAGEVLGFRVVED